MITQAEAAVVLKAAGFVAGVVVLRAWSERFLFGPLLRWVGRLTGRWPWPPGQPAGRPERPE